MQPHEKDRNRMTSQGTSALVFLIFIAVATIFAMGLACGVYMRDKQIKKE